MQTCTRTNITHTYTIHYTQTYIQTCKHTLGKHADVCRHANTHECVYKRTDWARNYHGSTPESAWTSKWNVIWEICVLDVAIRNWHSSLASGTYSQCQQQKSSIVSHGKHASLSSSQAYKPPRRHNDPCRFNWKPESVDRLQLEPSCFKAKSSDYKLPILAKACRPYIIYVHNYLRRTHLHTLIMARIKHSHAVQIELLFHHMWHLRQP